jgi:hypothetical protein
MMWRHKELHEMFRRSGLTEADFYSGTLHLRGKHGKEQQQQMTPGGGGDKHSPSSMATTLARPFSSQAKTTNIRGKSLIHFRFLGNGAAGPFGIGLVPNGQQCH